MNNDAGRYHRRSIRLRGYDYRTPGLYVATICTQHRLCVLGEVVDGAMVLSPIGEMVQTVWDELPWAYPGVEIDAFVVMPNHVHGIVCLLPDEAEGIEVARGGVGNLEQGQARGQQGQARGQQGQARGQQGQARGQQGQARGPAPTRAGVDGMGHAAAGAEYVGATPCGCPCPPTTASDGSDRSNDGSPRLSLPDVVHRFKSLTTARYRHGVRNLGWEPFPGRFWQRNYYETIVRSQDDLDRFRRYIDENPIRWSNDRHNPANPEIQ